MYLIPSDFNGFNKISKDSFTGKDLQVYIDKLEPVILQKLLGVELYKLFLADLDTNNVPISPIYKAIYDAFSEDFNKEIVSSGGMLELLKGFIYYYFMRDADFSSVISGKVKTEFANSSMATVLEYGLNERYNLSVQNHNAIQWFICKNKEDYPTYNGQKIEVQTWL